MAESQTDRVNATHADKTTGDTVVMSEEIELDVESDADLTGSRENARRWLRVAHPNEVRFLMLHVEESACNLCLPVPVFWTKLRDSLNDFDAILPNNHLNRVFYDEVERWWCHIESAWEFLMYSEGLADGERWSREWASPEELGRMRVFAASQYGIRQATEFNPIFTPGHLVVKAVCAIEGIPNGEELEAFWAPFVPVNVNDLKCRLFDSTYIVGFVDGAANLAGKLRAKFLDSDTAAAGTAAGGWADHPAPVRVR